MTWANYFSTAASLLIVTPVILVKFPAAEVSVWYLFATIIGLVQILDFGLSPTFSRLISYGHGGLPKHLIADLRDVSAFRGQFSGPNWETIEAVTSAMARTYSRLAWFSVLLLLAVGIPALLRPIAETGNQTHLWIAYGIIVLSSPRLIYGQLFASYLKGLNKVALTNRLQAGFRILGVLNSFVVLWLGGDILALVIVNQFWGWVAILRNGWLARHVENGRYRAFDFGSFDAGVMKVAWSAAWKTGLTTFIYMGYTRGFSLVIAQLDDVARVASFLLTMRILTTIEQFSMAPFFSKLPVYARLRAQGRIEDQKSLAQKNMRRSYWAFVLPVIGVGAIGPELLRAIGSQTSFVDLPLWSFLALSILVVRFSSMHLQLYLVSNHIISIQAVLPTLIVSILSTICLLPVLQVYAFPTGMLIGYLCYASWYSAAHSYKAMETNFWDFEWKTFIPILGLSISYIAVAFAVEYRLW